MDKTYFNTVITQETEYCDCCGHSYGDTYGYKVFADNSLAPEGVELVNGDLFIGGKKVLHYASECQLHKDLAQRIPSLFTIRYHDGHYPRFITGFDLLEEGKCYYNGLTNYNSKDGRGDNVRTFSSIKEAFDRINDLIAHDNWEIYLEEPLRI